jgi:hypothetical protein
MALRFATMADTKGEWPAMARFLQQIARIFANSLGSYLWRALHKRPCHHKLTVPSKNTESRIKIVKNVKAQTKN